MNGNMALQYLMARLAEPSTWAGIYTLSQVNWHDMTQVANVAPVIFGGLAVLMQEGGAQAPTPPVDPNKGS